MSSSFHLFFLSWAMCGAGVCIASSEWVFLVCFMAVAWWASTQLTKALSND